MCTFMKPALALLLSFDPLLLLPFRGPAAHIARLVFWAVIKAFLQCPKREERLLFWKFSDQTLRASTLARCPFHSCDLWHKQWITGAHYGVLDEQGIPCFGGKDCVLWLKMNSSPAPR